VSATRGDSLRRARARLLAWIIATGVFCGSIYGYANPPSDAPRLHGVIVGAVIGLMISGTLAPLEVFVLNGPRSRAFHRVPFLALLAARFAVYLAVIVLALALGRWFVEGRPIVERDSFTFSICASLGINFVFSINQLLGPGVLLSFVAGRYHRPRIEERVLLFIDLESSTRIAERLGEVRFLDFLNRFIADVTDAIIGERGEIHKYVGDELIVSWKLAAGLKEARCIRGCFGALDRLEQHASEYEREFGARANFRAALHCGPVVLGELGVIKQEIALIGDSMNTAARLQQACRDTGHRVLASAALIERIGTLPPDIVARALGALPLRGKASAIDVYALEAGRRVMMPAPAA
jgi:adenylate cyclase